MGRRGNPYDNAKAESFMKTLTVEAVYRWLSKRPKMLLNIFPLRRGGLQQTQASFGARLSESAAIRGSTHPADWQNSGLITVHPQGRTPIRDQRSVPIDNPVLTVRTVTSPVQFI